MTSQQPRPSRPRSTLIYDTGEREDDALEKMRWVVPAVFLGAFLVFFFSVVEWLSPVLPILLFFGLVWLPVAGFVVWRTWGSTTAKVIQAVLVLAAFGLPLAAWAAGPYRVAVMLAAGELIPQETMSTAIDDGSEGVASRACKRMLASDERQRVTRVSEVLTRRPQVAVDCLASLEDIQQGALVHIGQTLRQNWYQQWMNPVENGAVAEDADDADAAADGDGTGPGCAEAGAYPEVAGLYGVDGTPTLLMCALRAPNEQTAACCAESLSTAVRDEQRLVVEPQTWSADFQADLFGALADKVDLPAAALLADEAVDDSLRWTTGELFHWTSQLGCHLMGTSESPEGIARRLSKTIDTQCGLEVGDPIFSFAAVSLVRRTCEQAVGAEQRPVDVVQWCDAARQANGVTAVETAQFLVQKAISNQGLDELKRSMDRGAARAARQAQDEPIFSVGGGRRDLDVGTDGVRQGRPRWADHTPESKERLEAMEGERRRRRQQVRQDADGDVSTGEADRLVSDQMRQELLELRRAQEEDDGS